MTASQPGEEVLFNAARQIGDGVARAQYLRAAAGGDEGLLRRVEALLAVNDAPDRLLDQPAAAAVSTEAFTPASGYETAAVLPRETTGTVIGPYKLLQQIGEGGMGTVFMAEQTQPIQRRVALKIIKPGMDSNQVIARFEAERQALAMMDHVNIARVFDAGTTEAGRPYFVMELVHGVPITKYCDDNHLTPRERLELFVPVCQAIQHAHQKGVIHRDIKPSNVMVTLYDGKPVPKVIDFGVAKATEHKLTERSLFTQYGSVVGTLEYMSPEQAEMSALGVDTRSDIYSLGVLLYELLTGSTPLRHKRVKEAAYAEILRMIKEEEPQKPSTRLTDSGEALASISAHRHMEPAKLTKLVRGELDWIVMKTLEKDRNRRYETANAFAADVQRYLADEAVQACPPSAGYRFKKFARRNKAALAFTGLILLVLLTLTGGIGWNVRDRAARQTAVEHEVSVALKEAEQLQEQAKWSEALSAAKRAEGLLAGSGSEELRDRVHQLRKDLEMVLRLEEIPLLRSELKDNKYDHEAADRAYAQAFADYGIDVARLPAEEAGAQIRARTGVAVALAAALDDWAYCKAYKGKAGFSALTAVAQAADPDPWRRQVREAHKHKDGKSLAALAASPELSRQPPTTVITLQWALRTVGLVEARLEMLRRAQRQYPGDFWINVALADDLARMGASYRDEVVSFRRAALAVRPQCTALHNDLGASLKTQGKLDEAVACYRKAIQLDPKVAAPYQNLGLALHKQGLLDQAVEAYHKAIELDPKNANAYINLGNALADQNKLPEAVVAYRKAIELDPKNANAYTNLGIALSDQKNLPDAIVAFYKAIELDPKNANAYTNLGSSLYYQKKLPDAIAAHQQAIKIDPKDATAHSNLALALVELRDPEKLAEAVAAAEKAIKLDPTFANAHNVLGLALAAQKKLDEAATAHQRAIDLNPKHSDYHGNLGIVLGRQGKFDQAIACLRKALELDPKNVGAHHNLGIAYNNLGAALHNQKKLDEAIDAYHKAIEINPKYAKAYRGLGDVLKLVGKLDDAMAAYRKWSELDPNPRAAHTNLAWWLATDANPKFRDPKAAVTHARKALDLAPDDPNHWSNLGVALWRAGDLKTAVETLEKADRMHKNGDLQHRFFLAMAYWQIGEKDKARRAYDQAVEWMDKHQPKNEELRRFRAEAEEMLGVGQKKM